MVRRALPGARDDGVTSVYYGAFFLSLTATCLFVPVALWASRRWGALDMPDPRKVHTAPIPRWGGLAMFLGFLSSVAALCMFHPRLQSLLAFRHRWTENGEVTGILSIKSQLVGILVGGSIVFVLGMMDDKKPLPAVTKLLMQIIAAYAAMMYGVRIAGMTLPGMGYVTFPIWLSQAVTLFWMLGFMNTINLVDGLDGLAAGVAVIAAGTFLMVCVLQGETKVVLFAKQLKLAAVLSAALCGAAMGFLFFNFHPARIFMGDGGALFLGFILGAASVIGTLKITAVMAFVIPVLVIGLPVMDVAFAMFRRMRNGQGLFAPDKGHFHHRLLSRGWTQREVVFMAYIITLLLSLATLFLTFFEGRA
jgi:UDP-GlcNAc:undecaprenyl-phosphate GlcNAc-1-phosphate transferase